MSAMLPIVAETTVGAAPILGFYRDAEGRDLIAAAFERPGLGELVLTEGGLDVALKVMRRGEKPGLLIYDVGSGTNLVADIQTLKKHGGRALPIIALGGAIDVDRFRQLLAAGIFDYLDRALGSQTLADAVARARRQRARRATDSGPARSGRVIAFCGSRGGVGSTSSAIGLAWTLAHEMGVNTALLDLDLSFGTVAFALDMDPGRGLREGLDQPARIDAVFIERSLVRESPRLAVLAAEEPYDTAQDIDPVAATILLDELKQTFDCVVVDLPRGPTQANRAILAAADDIVLVTSASLAGLRDAIRWNDFVAGFADRATVRVLEGPSPPAAALPRAEFEKSLGRKIDLVVPFDPKSAALAANVGKAIPDAAPGTPVARAMSQFGALLGFAAEVEAPKAARLRWPWGARDAG